MSAGERKRRRKRFAITEIIKRAAVEVRSQIQRKHGHQRLRPEMHQEFLTSSNINTSSPCICKAKSQSYGNSTKILIIIIVDQLIVGWR